MIGQDIQETTKTTKKSLKTLQPTATDTDNLVGRPSKCLKRQLSQETDTIPVVVKLKKLSTKETQVNHERTVSVEDLADPHVRSEKYWQLLSEKQKIALQEALEENEKLHKIIKDLKEENALLHQMLDEANGLVGVFQELINDNSNDTGIDLDDIEDETFEETN